LWTDGNTRYLIGFKIWNKNDKKTRIDLAIELLLFAQRTYHIKPDYVLMDSFYSAARHEELLRIIRKLKWYWISKIKSNRLIDNVQVQDFFTYRYGNHIGKLPATTP